MASVGVLCLLLLAGVALLDARSTPRTTRFSKTTQTTPVYPVELEARASTKVDANHVWWDKGGFSKYDFACYEPKRLSSKWFVLGQRGQGNYEPLKGSIFAFKDPLNKALAMPYGFKFIWDDKGSIMNNDGSVWRVNCPPGYVALGDFFYPANRVESPGSDLYFKAMCVRSDMTEQCKFGGKIWDDSRSFAWNDVSVWSSLGSESALSGFLWAHTEHEVTPPETIHCLKKSAYREV